MRIRRDLGLALLCSCVMLGYGYRQDQDPLVEGFKAVAAAAREGRWTRARAALRELAPALDEIAGVLHVDLRPPLERALDARDGSALASALTRLGERAIALKLQTSRAEGLSDFYAAKYRVEAARTYYAELLAPAVRRRDADGAVHARIWQAFDDARAALGSPGFLGRGGVPPDPARFDAAAATIAASLREVFPFLEDPS